MYQCSFGIVFFLLLNFYSNHVFASPLCTICTCTTSSTETLNVNCSNITNSTVLQNQTIFKNISINKFTVRGKMLILKTKFPQSDLKTLDLSYNSIETIESNVFSPLQKMEELVLSFNRIEKIIPDVFRGSYKGGEFYPLHSLRKLKIDNNLLHTLHQDLFEHIDRIEVLNLNHNPFKVLDYSTQMALSSLVYLKELDLSYTGLHELPATFLHTQKSLVNLNLSSNYFTAVPKMLNQSHSLTTLWLNANPIGNLTKNNNFPRITTLKTLHMSYMKEMEAVEADSMSNLINLKEIFLNGGKLKYFDPAALNTNLFSLNIQNNRLSYLDENNYLQQVNSFDFSGNIWSCSCNNRWMIKQLIPIYNKTNNKKTKAITCSTPELLIGVSLLELSYNKTILTCKNDSKTNQNIMSIMLILTLLIMVISMVGYLWYFCKKNKMNHRYLGIRSFVHPYYSRIEEI